MFILAVLGFQCCWALSLVAASRDDSAVQCTGFPLRRLLLPRSTGSKVHRPSSCSAPRHVGSSRPGTRPMFPALAAGLFTTEWPGQPLWIHFRWNCLQHQSFSGGVGPIYLFFPFIACSFGVISKNPLCVCSVAKSYLTLCYPVDCSMPGLSCLHYLLEFAQIKNTSAYSWKSQRFASSFFFFFGCCIPLALIFRSVMRFELIFACGGR